MSKKLVTLLDLSVSSLRRGHANLLCMVPILSDDPRWESTGQCAKKVLTLLPPGITSATIDIPLLAFFRPGLCPNVLHSAAVSSGSSMPHMPPGAKAHLGSTSHLLDAVGPRPA